MLRQAVFDLKQPENPALLVGFKNADDAGVYLLDEKTALVQTVDFFTPIVDDPMWYGRIATANALSDVYAMGGKPLTALNILCYPEKMGPLVMGQILRGSLEKLNEAGCTLMGGHSVSDPEMKFGLSVTGLVDPSRIFSNERAQPGQSLVLTKKIGTGIITTAGKKGKCDPLTMDEAIRQMATLNDKASAALLKTKASTCTDITGFGLLGHLSEVLRASHIGARLRASHVPRFKGVEDLIRRRFLTRGDRANRDYVGSMVVFGPHVDEISQALLFDPQTSGGLLAVLPREDVAQFQEEMKSHGQDAWVIGETFQSDPLIEVSE